MTEILKPRTADEVAEVVGWAVGEKSAIELMSGGTKRGLGHKISKNGETHILDLSGVSGITNYEPEELVVSVRPGTLLPDLQEILLNEGQQLGFEPPDLGPLYGLPRGRSTVGGIVGCNLSGSRRLRAGAVRDHVLGLSCVSGRGETFKCGGRVVKNVTGYDLCKLLTGSYGTLAALTEVTLKVVPAPEKVSTFVLKDLDDAAAISAMAAGMNSAAEISAAAHIPVELALRVSGGDENAAASLTALRLEGPAPSVDGRLIMLQQMDAFCNLESTIFTNDRSLEFWANVRDVMPFSDKPDQVLWRLSVAPSEGAKVTAAISAQLDASWYYDWAGGLIWISVPGAEGEGGCAVIRNAIAVSGGHATLIRGPDALRSRVSVFQPQDSSIGRIAQQIKDAFDPHTILNPGRMTAGG